MDKLIHSCRERIQHELCLCIFGKTSETHQDDTGVDEFPTKYQLAKILISRQRQRFRLVGLLQNIRVLKTGLELRHIENDVTGFPQSVDDRFIDILVCNDVHSTAS